MVSRLPAATLSSGHQQKDNKRATGGEEDERTKRGAINLDNATNDKKQYPKHRVLFIDQEALKECSLMAELSVQVPAHGLFFLQNQVNADDRKIEPPKEKENVPKDEQFVHKRCTDCSGQRGHTL